MIDPKTLRKGDKVTFEVEDIDEYGVQFKGPKPSTWSVLFQNAAYTVERAPRPLEVGDKVTRIGAPLCACIIQAIVGDEMWVKFGATPTKGYIRNIKDYERVND